MQDAATFIARFCKLIHLMLKIRQLREDSNLSQDQMVAKTGIPKRSYVNYESGKTDIPLTKLQDIANALSVSIADLVEDENKRAAEPISNYQNDSIALVRSDIQDLSNALAQPLERLSDGMFKLLLDQQKILRVAEGLNLERLNKIGDKLEELLKQ